MERQEILQIFSCSVKMILGKSLSKIIVYGSYARGDYREDSDIDIMILTTLPFYDNVQKEGVAIG
ncbi:MAG: nucleotidyltransferase domain-containing protein [Lachnospiraceae bacterium]|nr:nucleotidyltransferase domain-containing protein [Lachnospiraceae bacterium]